MSNSEAPTTTKLPSSLLLCEALGFAPQLLLDDIINIANNAVSDGVNGMEEFLEKWADTREERRRAELAAEPVPPPKGKKGKKQVKTPEEESEDLAKEIEQGLVAFQTLLEYHTDIAFDFFEAWSLRNIFFIPPELEQGNVVVLPHYEGEDLTGGDGGTEVIEKEREMMDEIEELRQKLDDQRRLTRLLRRAKTAAEVTKRHAEKRHREVASLLDTDSLAALGSIPNELNDLYEAVAGLPPAGSLLAQPSSSQEGSGASAGKRPWETGTTGYVNWAVSRLVDGRRGALAADGTNPQSTLVDNMEAVTTYVGSSNDMRGAAEALKRGDMDVD